MFFFPRNLFNLPIVHISILSVSIRDIGIYRCMNLIQTHKCSLFMGLYIFEIKLCQLNSSVGAAWSEIYFVVSHGFISQKLKQLQESECLPFCPTDAAFFL